jgi:lysophospholipase L1-like esterase|tara:strand:+ start:38 stop:1093 length:1056 start_codon:yes stop_codon:yes gene_type:complete
MKFFFKNITKIFFTNFLILFSFIVLVELIFGYWFDKYNFGPYMREHRMKNQPTLFNYEGKTYSYNYKRNYYGFRGEDVNPENINAVIVGSSAIDERYKPDQFTITGYINKNLKNDKYDLIVWNAGIEAQSTVGIIYNFKNWFSRLENFTPKLILFYIGVNDTMLPEDVMSIKIDGDGHVKNPEKIQVILDNIKSRSFVYDSLRIFKFKFLPRKNFVKYDGNTDDKLKNNFKHIDYSTAIELYNIDELYGKYRKKIDNYLARVDKLYNDSAKINSTPVFITSITAEGHRELIFMLNYSLMSHCKLKKYYCIDVAKQLNGELSFWKDRTHTSPNGSKAIAKLIYKDLIKFIKK